MALRDVEAQLECPICLERYETPKVLPCQHTFCLRCLQNLVGNRNVVRCPECRDEHSVPADGVSGLPTSITVQRLLEASPPLNVPNVPSNNTGQHNRGRIPNRGNENVSINTNNGDTENRFADGLEIPALSPTALPLSRIGAMNQNVQPQEEDIELQVALERSAEDEHRRRRENPRNRNTHADVGDRGRRAHRQNRNTSEDDTERRIPAHLQNRNADAENNHRRNENQEKVRKHIHSVAGKIWNRHKTLLSAFIVTFAIVTFSRFIAGAAKLSSECDLEKRAAVYLFVKAWFAILFWATIEVWKFKGIFRESLENPFVEAYLVIDSLFSLCWLFVGTAWIMGNFNDIRSHCTEQIHDWNGHFINFALFITVIDYIGLVVFLFYSGYAICERERQTAVTPQ